MKVFCFLLLVVLATAAMGFGSHRRPSIFGMMRRQSCVDFQKARTSAAQGGDGCSQFDKATLPEGNEGPAEEVVTDIPAERRGPGHGGPGHGGPGREIMKKLGEAYECFMTANNVRDSSNATIVANLKTAINGVAKSQEKADAMSTAIDGCNTKKAETIPEADRKEMIKCVLKELFEKQTCLPVWGAPTTAATA